MADVNTTATANDQAAVSALVEMKLRQVGAIQEAIYRLAQHPHSTPDTEVMELAGIGGELVLQIETELGIRTREEVSHG